MGEIFKLNDIRGIYPSELNEQLAFRISRATIQFTRAKTVVVARDMRLSSPQLHEQVVAGALQQGAMVFDIGLASSDLFYFSVWKLKADAGIMVSASHNPKQYNGLKIVKKNSALSSETGLLEIKKLSEENKFKDAKKRGTVMQKNLLDDFVEFSHSFVDMSKIAPLKIVMDAGNGMASLVAPKVFGKLPIKIIPMFFGLDGNFPNHESNPLLEENRRALVAKVLEEKADFGVAWDGDADRVCFIDNNGEFIRGDFTLALLAKHTLQKFPGATVIYNTPSTKFAADSIIAFGGKPSICKVGHSIIQVEMEKKKAKLAGELSGHFYYSFKEFHAENGVVPVLQVLELLSTEKKKLSEYFEEAKKKYFISGEYSFTVADKDAVIKKIDEKYAKSAKKTARFDGLLFEFEDWWFSLRKSETEPLLRLNVEANSKMLMEQKRDELIAIIKA